MNLTNCSRVPNSQAVNLSGKPVESGLAPANPGQLPETVSSKQTNDGASPNSSEWFASDKDGRRLKFLSCKNRVFISTFNTRTLNPSARLNELVLSAMNQQIDIIAIQEHRIFHPDVDLKFDKIEGYHLITASCSKNSSNSSVGGVGLLLSNRAMENLLNIERISPRVLIADFEGNPKTTVLSCYSPHNGSSDEDIDSFYNTLRSTLENVPAHNFLLVPGDFNAQLGPYDAQFTFHCRTNRNGEHLVDLMDEFNLCPANTKFMKSKHHLWTFEYPDGHRAQLDYILVRKK